MKTYRYECNSCPSYCALEKEGELPPKNVCIENCEEMEENKGWHLVPVEGAH